MWGGRETNVEKALRIVKFGRLTVLAESEKQRKLITVCECGTFKEIDAGGLVRGSTQSCGCLQRETSAERTSKIFKGTYEDLTGNIYGRLTALSYSGTKENSRTSMWSCLCECGNIKDYSRTALVSGQTQSCGCLQKELVAKRMTKHGLADNPLYNTWRGMIDRCYNPACYQFTNYGGRGITVCDRWRCEAGLVNFIQDMGDKPDEAFSIDRIDNDKGYSPENCHWISSRNQMLNTRRSLPKKAPWAFVNCKTKKWYGCVSIDGVQKRFKDVDTPEEASKMVYDFLVNVRGEHIILKHEYLEDEGV